MTGADSSYTRQLRGRTRALAAASCRLDIAARIITAPGIGPGCRQDLAVIAAAIADLACTAGPPAGLARIPGMVLTALPAAVHEHDGQADDLTEQALAAMDGELASLEHAIDAGDVQAAIAAQARLVLCETVIEDVHAARKQLHDIQDRLTRHETAI